MGEKMTNTNKDLNRFLNATEFKQAPKKRTVETVKNELSKVDDKIEIMLEKGINETDFKLDKLNTKQNDLEIELEFLTYVMGEK
jgi:hypothetical protein